MPFLLGQLFCFWIPFLTNLTGNDIPDCHLTVLVNSLELTLLFIMEPEEVIFPFCEFNVCEPPICEEKDDPVPIMYEHGVFLKRVIITMWLLGWANFCMLGSTSYAIFFKSKGGKRLHHGQTEQDSGTPSGTQGKFEATPGLYEDKNNQII